jgi:hypothetical protein
MKSTTAAVTPRVRPIDPDAARRRRWCAWIAREREMPEDDREMWDWITRNANPFPEECRGLTCGARNRRGTPCKRIDINRGGRCKFHGGHSTGPRTAAGKAAAAANGRRRASKPHEP